MIQTYATVCTVFNGNNSNWPLSLIFDFRIYLEDNLNFNQIL